MILALPAFDLDCVITSASRYHAYRVVLLCKLSFALDATIVAWYYFSGPALCSGLMTCRIQFIVT